MAGDQVPGPMRWLAGALGAGLLGFASIVFGEIWSEGWAWQIALLFLIVLLAGVDLLTAAWTGRRRGIVGAVLVLGGL